MSTYHRGRSSGATGAADPALAPTVFERALASAAAASGTVGVMDGGDTDGADGGGDGLSALVAASSHAAVSWAVVSAAAAACLGDSVPAATALRALDDLLGGSRTPGGVAFATQDADGGAVLQPRSAMLDLLTAQVRASSTGGTASAASAGGTADAVDSALSAVLPNGQSPASLHALLLRSAAWIPLLQCLPAEVPAPEFAPLTSGGRDGVVVEEAIALLSGNGTSGDADESAEAKAPGQDEAEVLSRTGTMVVRLRSDRVCLCVWLWLWQWLWLCVCGCVSYGHVCVHVCRMKPAPAPETPARCGFTLGAGATGRVHWAVPWIRPYPSHSTGCVRPASVVQRAAAGAHRCRCWWSRTSTTRRLGTVRRVTRAGTHAWAVDT